MVPRLTIAPSKDYFLLDGKRFFMLADTVWSALYNPTEEEWAYYLDLRKEQGYNAIQMSITVMLDGGAADQGLYPFAIKDDGTYDFYQLNEAYFERARHILQMTVDKGFIPILIVMHARYTPGTWAEKVMPGYAMPKDAMERYVEYSIDAFKEFNPAYIVAGDTDLTNGNTRDFYWTALKAVKRLDPEGLTCFHLTPDTDLSDEFANSDLLDFYALQPGHSGRATDMAYKLIQAYYNEKAKKPIFNSEFFYDGHSYTSEQYGRFNEFDQRRAIWQSVLAGSKAGIGYGSQGVWGWHTKGKATQNAEFGGEAYRWQVALQFEGAWEGSFAKFIFEQFDLYDVEPADVIINDHELQRQEIRASASPDKFVMYVPYSTDVKIALDLTGYKFSLIEMRHKHFGEPDISIENGVSTLSMPAFNSDYLLIGIKMN